MPGSQLITTMTDRLARSLTLTKLQRPRVGRRLVPRPYLLDRLNASPSLTLVLAPAGYGKTTLLSTWLETCNIPGAWLSLDERDDDLAIFVTNLVGAVHTIFPAAADTTLAAASGATAPPPGIIARTLLNDLVAVEQDFILVLDDYHVIRSQAVHELLTELVQHPPRSLHLVIASRFDPPLPLAALRARGYVTELRRADLRFTPEEAGQFLTEAMALAVDERMIALLAAKTEGWPAGLHLAALSLRQQRAPGMIAANSLGDNRYVMDYLTAEVLSPLPISVQEFLIKTSILDQLCGPLCEAVTGMVDRMFSGQYILEWLERADLFLAPADEQQQWYRYHQLFRQLLRERLEKLHGPAEIAALHLRASEWFAANGDLDVALHHALAANDMAAAVQIVAQHRHELMNQAQWQRLDRWVNLFPREVIDRQPDLLLAEVWLKYIRQQLSAALPLLDRIEALLPGLPPEMADHLQGEVESRRSALSFWSGDLARSMTLARQALVRLPAEWWYSRGYARIFLGSAYQMSGDLAQAYATFYATGEPDQGRSYQNLLTGSACYLHWVAADLAGMAQAARQVVASSAPSDRSEIVTWSQFHLGLYYYQRNELAAAEKHLLPLVMQPYALHAGCFLNSAVVLARIRQAQGWPEEAQEIADLVLSFALETRSEVVLFGARAFQAELALRQGRLAEATQWAEQYGSFTRVPAPWAFVPPLVLAQTLLAQDTPASRRQARELLTEMDEYYTSIHYTSVRIRVLALQAMLYSAENDEPQALAALAQSIALAESGGFLRFFVDLGAPLKPLLQKLERQGVSPAYVAEILAAFGTGETLPPAGRPPRAAPVPTPPGSALLTNRELDVLQLLDERYTDKEIAETLSISMETVRTHVRHISDKLGARGRRAIVQAAQEQGLLA
jgi:LuxR family transcriptional regulator, maltose regulon positive regulatory protein